MPEPAFNIKAAMRRVLRKEARAAHRRRSHDGKTGYGSEWGAKCAARDMERAHPGQLFDHYKCEHCAEWHVGHSRSAGMEADCAKGHENGCQSGG